MKKDVKSNNKYNYAIMLGVAGFIGVVLISLFIIKPLYNNSAKLKLEASAKDARYQSLEKKKSSLSALKVKEAELKAQASVVADALPADKEVGKLFIQLDELVAQSSGTLQSVTEIEGSLDYSGQTTSTETGLDSIQKYTYALPVLLPDYTSFKKFISKSESALRLFSIKSIDISAGDTGNINATVTANTFTRK